MTITGLRTISRLENALHCLHYIETTGGRELLTYVARELIETVEMSIIDRGRYREQLRDILAGKPEIGSTIFIDDMEWEITDAIPRISKYRKNKDTIIEGFTLGLRKYDSRGTREAEGNETSTL